MGYAQSKALVIGKRGRQIGACVFLCTLCDGATAELCGGSRSGRENKRPPSILAHLPYCSKHPVLGSGGLLGLLVSLSLGHLCMTEGI